MENLVTSQETSKKMQEAGFEKESYFWLTKWDEKENPEWVLQTKSDCEIQNWDFYDAIPAYTLGELMEWLMQEYILIHLYADASNNTWCSLPSQEKIKGGTMTTANSPQEAVALMLIHLAEKGIIDPKKLK